MHRIGIIDWGIGGISIYKLIRGEIKMPITYFSDTGVTPYGKMSRSELPSRLDGVIEYLKNGGVTHVVIGCNAASTAIGSLADQGIPVLGVIESAVARTASLKPTALGLIGGRRTVVSGVYRRAFAEHGINIHQRIAQPLSGMIESGDVASPRLREAATHILAPLRNCSHILLACTHYPAIQGVLSEFVSSTTRFIDPAAALMPAIRRWNLKANEGRDDFLTTGDPSAMKRAARAAFGVSIPSAKHIDLKCI